MKIAIIGGGITGITLAWLLSGLGKVVVYERGSRLAVKHGSIAESVVMSSDPEATPQPNPPSEIPSITSNLDKSPPLFFPYYQTEIAALFEYLGIYTEPCALSYRSSGKFPLRINNLPANELSFKNIAPLVNMRIEKDIRLLYRSLERDYRQDNIPISLSLRQYMRGIKLHANSISEAIYPVIGALWSYPPDVIQDLAASKHVRFVNEGKLLDRKVNDQVRYIPGGLDKYLRKLLFKGSFEYQLNNPVTKIKYSNSTINLTDSHKSRKPFDKVIITSSPQDAKKIIDPEISAWSEALSKVVGNQYPIHVHQDNAIIEATGDNSMSSNIGYELNLQKVSYNYNLGKINQLPDNTPAAMSINLDNEPQNIIYKGVMNRPALDVVNTRYYKELQDVQGTADIFYCTDGIDHGTSPMTGGINSALIFAKELGVKLPF